ncbi:TetR/AcrR family transcriptional regulator [Pediococcus claussenii]|uniref:Transcriptional regulator, TetR family n=1 Tax=Pediococcus claussenii (strain ATCC BAA-344 / DSM 14800 / JCM 18046 / KCTC 3811 / LMG 21948 / P06) TaxID=701521 RepID=G8PAW8_PEDCP|nr:helix-turn-helix domain-containing protein [Pediococcus claussenii]AEV95836.1 Transcriptional regulator, TetR family [Pediococcus claussenii ATCC BAA-344]ANZ69333.1 hypothetical protein AYR57_03000 [Pediococcus claussenii]ANZ71153.1 hypothetical protein AYR58_03015 [Pediococcus claussenii]KRN20442.1 hypothetical protein IV79_GL000497 [Pediococcus claussenii]
MVKMRRHGSELEAAIYTAALELLKEDGFSALSFGKIATRANTSKSVIYRRWNTPFELIISAVQAQIISENNGRLDQLTLNGKTLEADLSQLFKRLNISLSSFGALSVGNLIGEVSQQQSEILRKMINDATKTDKNSIDKVILRAQHRGELGPGDLPETLQLLPFEWLRYHVFIGGGIDQQKINDLINLVLIPSYKNELPPK